MAKRKLILGAHMSIAGGLGNALIEAKKYRCGCVQMFVANQRQWRHGALSDEQIADFRQIHLDAGISPVVAHSSYLINLAAGDRDIYRKSQGALADELDRCEKLGIDYLVFHPGAHVGQGEQVGLDKIVAALDLILDKAGDLSCKLLLETTAGQGTCLGHTFEHLAYIIDRSEHTEQLGVCLDTCHVFAAGYDLRTKDAYQQTIKQFDDTISLKKLMAIHVNDSRTEFNSHVDRHEHIGKGYLGKDAFVNLLSDTRLSHLPFILETPKVETPGGKDMDLLNLATLGRLAKDKT